VLVAWPRQSTEATLMSAALGLNSYPASTLVFIAAAAALAGLARGLTGFGAALIFIPLASTVTGPKLAAPLLLVVDYVMAAGLIPNAWRTADRREVGIMLIGTLIGVPIGAYVLTRADPITIRWMIAAIVFPLLAVLMSGWRYHGKPRPALTSGVGAAAGFLSGVAQIGGPPVVLYWLGAVLTTDVVRANIVLYFAASATITLVVYAVGGLLAPSVVGLALLTAPVYGLALYVGSRMFGLASERVFRGICYALIAAAGVVSLPVLDGVVR
jgi:uncharacterized membrane protein YfcA